jgi:hypothetical protein
MDLLDNNIRNRICLALIALDAPKDSMIKIRWLRNLRLVDKKWKWSIDSFMMMRMKERFGAMKMFELCESSTNTCDKCGNVFNFGQGYRDYKKCSLCRHSLFTRDPGGDIAIGYHAAVATHIHSIAIGRSSNQ